MGIPKLFDLLESVKTPAELKDFSGKKIAVDGHCWIFNAMFMYKFRVKRGTSNPLWISYLQNRLDELKENNIIPIIVFDGQKVPIKRPCYLKRQEKYEKPIEHTTPSAWESYELVKQSVKILKQRGIEYIIAPFEADPQLAYLSNTNKVDAILTIDSDLLVFGCKQVLVKRQQSYYSIKQVDIFKINEKIPRGIPINLTAFNQTRFRHLCILAGCDYLPGFKQVGLKRVLKLMYQYQDIDEVITQLLSREEKPNYRKEFENANAGFLYQYVFDIDLQIYKRLNPLPPGKLMFDMEVLGESPRLTNIPMHGLNDAIDVDKVDLDGLETLFENLHIDSAVSSPSLSSETSTFIDEDDSDFENDHIEIQDDVIKEIALKAYDIAHLNEMSRINTPCLIK